jgi:hypothetical protein
MENIASVLEKTDKRIMKTKIPEELVESPTLPDGKMLMMLTRKSPLYDKGKNVIGIIGISVDVTYRKKIEDLESKLRIEEELYTIAKEVAHDIASPLSSLKACRIRL